MSTLTVRSLAERDFVKAGKVIQKSLLRNLKSQELSEEIIHGILERYDPPRLSETIKGKILFVCEEDTTQIIGVGGLRRAEGSSNYNCLTTFFVDPDYQGRGAGRLLYEKAKSEAVDQGCTKLVVNSSPEAELFYEHLGFRKVKTISKEYPNGSSHHIIRMEQELKA